MRKYFSEEIPKFIDDYEERPEQIAMAEAVKDSLDNSECLIIEAGTGVGKTLAYLIPMAEYSLNNQKRVIISTYSKALQSQIYKKDLPLVKKLFPDLKYEIIFGAANYVCVRRFKEFQHKGSLFVNAKDTSEMMEFLSNGEGLRENTKFHIPQEVWDSIKREKNLCHEELCPHFRKCYYWGIRHKLRKANIIVVNHYLFFSDLLVNKKLLPEASSVVFDEAHKLEDTMRDMFSRKFSGENFIDLLKELEDFLKQKKRHTKKEYREAKAGIKAGKKEFEDFVGSLHKDTSLGLDKSSTVLLTRQSRGIETDLDIRRALKDAIFELNDSILNEDDKDRKKFAEYMLESVHAHADVMEKWLSKKDASFFYWIERERDGNIVFYITPYDLKKDFEEHVRFNYETVVFTSATLSAGDNFNYVIKQFGLNDATTGMLKSPFDYKNNALLYIEKHLSTPQSAEYRQELEEKLEEIIKIVRGNMFVLFTSIDMMKKMYKAMKQRFDDIPMLVQGEASPMELVEQFKENPSVLFATSTFWQGIDIKGDALRCVVITRLPFEVPEHPMQKAIYSHVVEEGGNDFAEIALPRAIFMLKQGFGRLIRSKADYGAVMILDSRISNKSYGQKFIKSLPEARITHTLEDVKAFFEERS